MPARLAYCCLEPQMWCPGDGDLHGFRRLRGRFLGPVKPPPAPEVTVSLLVSEVQINCEQLCRSPGAQ